MNFRELVQLPENLVWAWRKVQRLSHEFDSIVDYPELAAFELDLERQLQLMGKQLAGGRYRLSPLRPIPQPKRKDDGSPALRQYFRVAVRDQVAWTAVVNVIGPTADLHMPKWSYGNRLYRASWPEEEDKPRSKLIVGPYRHSRGHLYKPFPHSWPLFRRAISLTARRMVGAIDETTLDDAELQALMASNELAYVQDDFWHPPKSKTKDVYYGSLDLKQFYPSLKKQSVLAGLRATLPALEDEAAWAQLDRLLSFKVSTSGVPKALLDLITPPSPNGDFDGIPTGLFVGGFLANAAMSPVDKVVDLRVHEKRSVAHFRFVDDHAFLATDFDELIEWMRWYREALRENGIKAEIHEEKFDPPELSALVLGSDTRRPSDADIQKTREKCHVDGRTPTRLMTKTLRQVSAIAHVAIDTLDDDELKELQRLLEWLLQADIPDREIRSDTRKTFAAGKLASLAGVSVMQSDGFLSSARKLSELEDGASKAKDAQAHAKLVAEAKVLRDALRKEHLDQERHELERHFKNILQALKEFPEKPRLFIRLVAFCSRTGFEGLNTLADWITDQRQTGRQHLADFYYPLLLSCLSVRVTGAVRRVNNSNLLRADRRAAKQFLSEVSRLRLSDVRGDAKRKTYYSVRADHHFAFALLAAAEELEKTAEDIAAALRSAAEQITSLTLGSRSSEWQSETGLSLGVWIGEREMSHRDQDPSDAWIKSRRRFDYSLRQDWLEARRYPKALDDAGWNAIREGRVSLHPSDSGWLWDAIENHPSRIQFSLTQKQLVFKRASHVSLQSERGRVRLPDWLRFQSSLPEHDPRASEWTALEVLRQIVDPLVQIDDIRSPGLEQMDRIHPLNITVPFTWTAVKSMQDEMPLTWERWRKIASDSYLKKDERVRLGKKRFDIHDYRYGADSQSIAETNPFERPLLRIGQLLIDMLRMDCVSPPVSNIRGVEHSRGQDRRTWLRRLAVSSPTLNLIDACLTGRARETLSMPLRFVLHGLTEPREPWDTEFDPPKLTDVNVLLDTIANCQALLERGQLAVTGHSPRQLVPVYVERRDSTVEGEAGDADDT